MARFHAISSEKQLRDMAGESLQTLVIIAIVLGAAAAVAVVGLSSNKQTFAVAGGLCIGAICIFASGNPRLACLWGFMLTLPLSLSKRVGPMYIGKPGGEDSFRIEVNDLFLLVLAIFILWDLMTERRRGIRIPKVTYIWLLLTGIGCVWVVIGPWHTTAAHEVVRMLKVMLLFLVVTNEVNRPGRIRHCIAALSLAAIGEAVIALIQYRMKGLIGLQILGETSASTINVLGQTSVEGVKVFRPSGLLEHANLLGVFLAVVIPLAVAMLLVSRRPLQRCFFILTIGIAMPAEIIAMSRAAWVAAAVGLGLLIVLMFMHRGLMLRAVVTATVTSLIGIVILIGFMGPIADRLLSSKEDSARAREIYKADARNMIEAAPWFGHGLNSYVFELPDYATLAIKSYGDQPPAVHNIFYLWWAETGIVGMLIFCSVWASIIYTGFTNLTVRDDLLFVVNAACLAAMIGLIPDSFLSFTLRVNTMLRLFWFLAGLIMAVRYLRLDERYSESLHRDSAELPQELVPESVPS